ncbi:acyltransferase family protein [Nonomuraea jiangxiensis]|uniref:Peptidoglycan/LPS O-acetylase OafA/YrhL, contains acyltransferase and SGNH-hydrolase domains n=1 Tax=Nonomuraea jiangxiensis TaxID=633440 RepID=A0A1G8TVK3_9ACTN|nr:acyltransferase [Nonomuraea jiangxiensis]SDJ44945.1 Peptidoglycan/LPS O-acetylase OafA/YrhL, contains acyltransferase and SGNH-hydrolase domains [Nonomuraea jiangxiensis]
MSINLAAREGGGAPRAEVQPQAPAPARRQTWLDALRGVAVLAVLFEHLLDPLFPEVRATVSPWFDFGQYGVLVFFLISGYVVPASLERRGSVAGFWINRAFRLYPLWILAAVAGTAFGVVQVYSALPGQLGDHPVTSAVAHLTMLQDVLQVVSVVNVFWTLTYEMVFYLLVTALFVAGRHRVSTAGTLVLAMAAVLVGGVLPAGALSRGLGGEAAVLVATAVLVLGLAAILGGDHRVRLCGAAAVGLLAVVLLGTNSRVGAWESLAIVTTMFAGTALYRLDQGQLGRGLGRWVIGLVPVVCVTAAFWFGPGWTMSEEKALAFRWSWSAAVAGAWLTFAAGRLLRSYALPRFLARLGLISYSVYLLHPLAVQILRRLVWDPAPVPLAWRITWSVVLLAVVVACSALTYRFVEQPAQRLGRRLARATTR